MTPTQLLAIDTILPTVLGCAGLVFLAIGLFSLGGRSDGVRVASFALVGIAAVVVGVWMWNGLVSAAGRIGPAVVAPSSPIAQPVTKPSASAPASASTGPSSAAVSASAAPVSQPPASPPTVAPTSTPTLSLTPIPVTPFQPENTNTHAAVIGVQAFERGSMLYRDDLKQIYVLTPDKKFTVYKDTWVDGTNPDLAGAAPEGKLRPGRGFGWLWYSDPDVRNALGFAITAEQGFTGSIGGDGTATTIRADVTYAFNKDGTWALK
jgi:hypothetical protein